jgi:bifunctional oligoribonuclease and PAP phosphatase NrnA
MQSIELLAPHLQTPCSICITTHQFPDADALGSSLSLQMYLQAKGHKVHVLSSTPFPENLAWMAGAQQIIVLDQRNKAVLQQYLDDSSILFCLDFNVATRTKDLTPLLQTYQGTKVLIDHHMEPDEAYFDFGISLASKSSTCEMIYDYIAHTNGDAAIINKDMAECMYAGVMTDTGSFRFASTAAQTHDMVAGLMRAGAVPHKIHELIFDTFPEKRLRLLGFLLSQRLLVLPELNAAYMWLSEADSAEYKIQQGDTEGFVNYALGIKGIEFAAFVTSRDGDVRMSFRSKGNVDVNQFARQHFNGGGHHNAAGGRGLDTVENTLTALLTALKQWKA